MCKKFGPGGPLMSQIPKWDQSAKVLILFVPFGPQSQRNFALALNRFPACTHDHAQRGDELKPWFVAGQRNSNYYPL